MARYLISFNAGAMDHITAEDLPDVGKAAHGRDAPRGRRALNHVVRNGGLDVRFHDAAAHLRAGRPSSS